MLAPLSGLPVVLAIPNQYFITCFNCFGGSPSSVPGVNDRCPRCPSGYCPAIMSCLGSTAGHTGGDQDFRSAPDDCVFHPYADHRLRRLQFPTFLRLLDP